MKKIICIVKNPKPFISLNCITKMPAKSYIQTSTAKGFH